MPARPTTARPTTTRRRRATLRFSAVEVLRDKDFADYTDDELAEAHRWMAALRVTTAPRRSRRLARRHRPRGRPDLRRTVREALRAGGEPVRRRYRRHSERPRRLVLLLDVSGSMEPYARALLRFVHAAVVGRARGRGVHARHPADPPHPRAVDPRPRRGAARRDRRRCADWSGGTRLGDGLAEFNDGGACAGMARGATVVVLSDGWDRGDPGVLAEQMARLRPCRVPGRVGQPAQGVARLRAAGAGHGRRAALRRRVRRGPLARRARSAGRPARRVTCVRSASWN